MKLENKYAIGDIVTLKTHPLFDNDFNKIAELPAHVPPLMIIKEIIFERKENKKKYSSEIKNAQISDLIKYNCVYFNANKSEFIEKIVYESFLRSYKDLQYFRVKNEDIDGKEKEIPLEEQLIPEVLDYKIYRKYNFGDVVQFKTKKLEHRKSYKKGNEKIPGACYQTPNFIVSGVKKVPQEDLFFNDGKTKKIIPKKLLKILWFNHFHNKMSEFFLPFNFFVKNLDL